VLLGDHDDHGPAAYGLAFEHDGRVTAWASHTVDQGRAETLRWARHLVDLMSHDWPREGSMRQDVKAGPLFDRAVAAAAGALRVARGVNDDRPADAQKALQAARALRAERALERQGDAVRVAAFIY